MPFPDSWICQKGTHAGRPLQLFLMKEHPLGWVIFDILPGFVIILLIADDVIVIGFLPELFVKWTQDSGLNTSDVIIGRHSFEIVHDIL